MGILEVEDLIVQRTDGWAVRVPSLRLAPGEVAALYGPSGCGKTTLLLAMFGLQPREFTARGAVRLEGTGWRDRSREARRQFLRTKVTFLMQDAASALDPLVAVGDQMVAATDCSTAECTAALEEMGVGDAGAMLARVPSRISGGQAQRVLLAVAWLRRSRLIVADEPSASLDGGSFDDLVRRLLRLRDHGAGAVLLATHDDRLLAALDARILQSKDGAFLPGELATAPWTRRAPSASGGTVPLLSARGVTVRFDGRTVLDALDLQVGRGEVVALLGESGAGKTTLARVLAGHLQPDSGEVQRPSRRQAVQLLFQDAPASVTPGRTLRELLAETRTAFFDTDAMAARVGLGLEHLGRTVTELSGGERRRAALLRALSVNPELLLLDEPTASLDRATATAVMDTVLAQQAHRGLSLLIISHDETIAAAMADRVLRLRGGKICPD